MQNKKTNLSDIKSFLRKRVEDVGFILENSNEKIENEWGAGYRICTKEGIIVAGLYGYGYSPEEVCEWCEAKEKMNKLKEKEN